ncbi:MAG: NAD(P)/FAD-dependent oxidoreductase, partial [Pyrinomonadaceae bacterium]
ARNAQDKSKPIKFRSRLCIDASGRTRALARRISKSGNLRTQNQRAGLVAFKAHLSAAQVEDQNCEIYFYRGGYGGLNQIESGLFNLCFIVDAATARSEKADAGQLMQKVVMQNVRASETLSEARVETPWIAVAIDSFGQRDLAPAEGLLTVGDAASFIDPFTGSGMLMALESGEVIAGTIARHMESNSKEINQRALAAEYAAAYGAKFDRRLRFCSLLRRVAFAPQWTTQLIIQALSLSGDGICRYLARATRGK